MFLCFLSAFSVFHALLCVFNLYVTPIMCPFIFASMGNTAAACKCVICLFCLLFPFFNRVPKSKGGSFFSSFYALHHFCLSLTLGVVGSCEG